MGESAFEELAEVLPNPDMGGNYFWQAFADRLQRRFEGIPGRTARDRSWRSVCGQGPGPCRWCAETACGRKGLLTVPADGQEMSTNCVSVWAFSTRRVCAVWFRVCRGCGVKCGDAEWYGVSEDEQPFSEFAAGKEDKIEIEWTGPAPDFGMACLVTQVFFPVEEALLLTPELAREVNNHANPGGPSGLFGLMLVADGQEEKPSVDVARVFLHALGEAVEQKALKVNTKMGGHVFITPEFWLLTNPVGVNSMNAFIRTRRGAPRHDFTRHEVFRALREGGYLIGVAEGWDTRHCVLKSRRWRKPLELHGLCIAAGVLFSVPGAPFFEGTVTIKEESVDGSSE